MWNYLSNRIQSATSVKWGFVLLFLGLMVQTTPLAHAEEFKACAVRAAARDLAAKKDFQDRLHQMIVDDKPEFKALAALNRDLQIQLAEERKVKIDYLLETNPERIITHHGLSKFSNFTWSDADESRFLEKSEANRKRMEKISDLRKRNNFHADWPRMRGYFRSELTKKPAYKTLMTDFTKSQVEVKNILSSCPVPK
jgi:hypothetical protein